MAESGLRELERKAMLGDVEAGLRLANQRFSVGNYAGAHQVFAWFLSVDNPVPEVIDLYQSKFPFCIDNSLDDRWRLKFYAPSVDSFVEDDLAKELLDGGQMYAQAECAQRLGSDWNLQGLRDYSDFLIAMYLNRFHPDEDQRGLVTTIKDKLGEDLRGNYLIMGSAVLWRPKGRKDLFIPRYDFNKGDAEQKGREADLVGFDSFIKPGENLEDTLEITHGIRDCQLIQKAGFWISGKNFQYWRFDKRPSEEQKRVVALVAELSQFSVDLYGIINGIGCARGWSRRRAEKLPFNSKS